MPLDTTLAKQVRAAEAAYSANWSGGNRRDIDPALTAPLSFDPDARQSRYPYPRGNLHESAAGKAGAMTPQSLRTAFDKETGRLAPRAVQKLTAFTSHHDSGQFFSYFLRKPKFDTLQSQGVQ